MFGACVALVFSGCSQKKYFDPEDVQGSLEYRKFVVTNDLVQYSSDGGTYDKDLIVSANGIQNVSLKPGYQFINENDSKILAANAYNQLVVIEGDEHTTYTFDKNIINGAIKNDLLLVGFTDNSMTLYDTKQGQVKLKEYFQESILNDTRIANPIFLDTIALYPTLDGKLAIIDLKTFQIIRTINIDPDSQIRNIIYFKTVNDIMVAATSNKLFVFGGSNVASKDLDIKQVVVKDKMIYVTTLDGQIIKYDFDLKEQARQKFRFAKFMALASGDEYIYAVESQEYIIRLDLDLKNYIVTDFSFDENEKIFALEDKIYFEDKYIQVP